MLNDAATRPRSGVMQSVPSRAGLAGTPFAARVKGHVPWWVATAPQTAVSIGPGAQYQFGCSSPIVGACLSRSVSRSTGVPSHTACVVWSSTSSSVSGWTRMSSPCRLNISQGTRLPAKATTLSQVEPPSWIKPLASSPGSPGALEIRPKGSSLRRLRTAGLRLCRGGGCSRASDARCDHRPRRCCSDRQERLAESVLGRSED